MPSNPTPQAPQNALEGGVGGDALKDTQNGSTARKTGLASMSPETEEWLQKRSRRYSDLRLLLVGARYRAALARGVWWG